MLYRLVNVCDGSEDAEQQRREHLVVVGDILEGEGNDRVHLWRSGSALVGGHRVGVVCRLVWEKMQARWELSAEGAAQICRD